MNCRTAVAATLEYHIDTADRISAYETRANMHTTTFVGALGARLKATIGAIGDGYNTATFVSRTEVKAVTIARITSCERGTRASRR